MQEEEQLPVADARQARTEPAGRTAFMLGLHRVSVALPVLAVGRVRDQVVEAMPLCLSLESVLP